MLALLRILFIAALVFICTTTYADLVIVVHPDNKLESLSTQQLQRIFLGRMPLFPHNSQEIVALDMPEHHPAYAAFYKSVVKMEGSRLKRYRAYYLFSGRGKLPRQLDSATEVLNAIATNPRAIGYLPAGSEDESVRVLITIESPSKEQIQKQNL